MKKYINYTIKSNIIIDNNYIKIGLFFEQNFYSKKYFLKFISNIKLDTNFEMNNKNCYYDLGPNIIYKNKKIEFKNYSISSYMIINDLNIKQIINDLETISLEIKILNIENYYEYYIDDD